MGLGDILSGLSQGIGQGFFPTDPNEAGLVDPQLQAAARNRGLINLGLGIMQAPYSPTGLAGGFNSALQGATQDYQSAMDNAFKHTLLKRQLDYEQQAHANQLDLQKFQLQQQQRAEREAGAQTLQRVSTGLSTSGLPPEQYWQLVQNQPEVQAALKSSNITSPYSGPMANPANLDAFRQQLATAAQVGLPAQAPVKLGRDEQLLIPGATPGTFTTAASGPQRVEYKDAGDKLIPVDDYGRVVPGLAPIPKNLTPFQNQRINITSGALEDWTPEALQMAAEQYRLTGKLPPNLGKGSPVTPKVIELAAHNAIANGDDATAAIFRQQAVAANKVSLAKLQPTYDASKAYAANLEANLAKLEPLVGKVDATGVPFINRAFTDFKNGVAGNRDTAAFVTYLADVQSEFAKLRSGALGNAPLSDSQLKEARTVMLNAYSEGGFQGLAEAIRGTAQSKLDTYGAQLATMRAGAGLGGPPQPTPSPTPAPSALPRVNSPADLAKVASGAHFIGPDGVERVKH